MRSYFKTKPAPCWACGMNHCHTFEILEGPHKGFVGDEPEYECVSAMSSVIGQEDPANTVVLANLVDRLGLDVNESGWVVDWVMECYHKGILDRDQLEGLEMNWVDAANVGKLMRRIAGREGFGNALAEGVKRAAEQLGGEALSCTVFTLKGASFRGHDHRARFQRH